MNSQLIQQGRAAYRAGDFSAAAQMLGAAKTPNEIMGEADHLRGNALMHLGMYAEAAEAYAAALNDGAYGTLFDVHSATARCRPRLGDKADRLSETWRRKQLEYTWLRSLMGRFEDFWRVTGEALDYALEMGAKLHGTASFEESYFKYSTQYSTAGGKCPAKNRRHKIFPAAAD